MKNLRSRSEEVRKFILGNIEQHSDDIAKITAKHFGITRQAVHKHLQSLVAESCLNVTGTRKNKIYELAPILEFVKAYQISTDLAEDKVWRNDIRIFLGDMPDNVINIWHYGFTEMFNNAIDHSGSSKIVVKMKKTVVNTELAIFDSGMGIFKKIQTTLNLIDERHALVELSKGKLTTDPKRHSGEGIFFTSKMFDAYDILSGGVYFSHEFGKPEDWIMERNQYERGTFVWMKLDNHTPRVAKKIFDQYASPNDDYVFNKTIVPVRLAQYGNDMLVSRSQAKRLLERVELFRTVIFDFKEVPEIGQAFADEIFRVFANQHPEIKFLEINESKEVKQMIRRAKGKMV